MWKDWHILCRKPPLRFAASKYNSKAHKDKSNYVALDLKERRKTFDIVLLFFGLQAFVECSWKPSVGLI